MTSKRTRVRRVFSSFIGFDGKTVHLEPRLLLSADVLTYHNDNARTGANLTETVLTPTNVNFASFGKLGQVAVDGDVYGQPLVKTGVTVPNMGKRDIVYVATEHDSVYAFDAKTLEPIWHDSFINPAAGITPLQSKDVNTQDIYPEIGITSTPVIDSSTSTMYVVSAIKFSAVSGAVGFVQQIHALDLATGAEKLGGPVDIQATVPGNGAGSARGMISYQAQWQNQRPALLLSNGVVYIAAASFADHGPYHGWVLGYNAQTLKLASAINDTPNGVQGGIWMAGGGPAADAFGNIYLSTGNGTTRTNGLKGDFGDAVLKLHQVSGQLKIADYFIPSNQARLKADDIDLGSGGVVLLPDQSGGRPHLLVTGGKDGTIYLLDRDKMGGYSRNNRIVQGVHGTINAIFDTPAYFNGKIYYLGTGTQGHKSLESLKAFSLAGGKIVQTPMVGSNPEGFPGSSPSVSANGSIGGIVWTLTSNKSNSNATLRAYDALDISHELYNNLQAASRDRSARYVKFTVPTVVNGKVYVAGGSALTLYGLLANGS